MRKGGKRQRKSRLPGLPGLPTWSELLISRQSPVAFEEGQRLDRERGESEREGECERVAHVAFPKMPTQF